MGGTLAKSVAPSLNHSPLQLTWALPCSGHSLAQLIAFLDQIVDLPLQLSDVNWTTSGHGLPLFHLRLWTLHWSQRWAGWSPPPPLRRRRPLEAARSGIPTCGEGGLRRLHNFFLFEGSLDDLLRSNHAALGCVR